MMIMRNHNNVFSFIFYVVFRYYEACNGASEILSIKFLATYCDNVQLVFDLLNLSNGCKF